MDQFIKPRRSIALMRMKRATTWEQLRPAFDELLKKVNRSDYEDELPAAILGLPPPDNPEDYKKLASDLGYIKYNTDGIGIPLVLHEHAWEKEDLAWIQALVDHTPRDALHYLEASPQSVSKQNLPPGSALQNPATPIYPIHSERVHDPAHPLSIRADANEHVDSSSTTGPQAYPRAIGNHIPGLPQPSQGEVPLT